MYIKHPPYSLPSGPVLIIMREAVEKVSPLVVRPLKPPPPSSLVVIGTSGLQKVLFPYWSGLYPPPPS